MQSVFEIKYMNGMNSDYFSTREKAHVWLQQCGYTLLYPQDEHTYSCDIWKQMQSFQEFMGFTPQTDAEKLATFDARQEALVIERSVDIMK
jgi:hypothetical protein